MPQPNFVPVMASTSRSVQSNGMSPGMSRSRDFPLTLSVIIVSPIHCNRELRTLDQTASAETNLLDDGIGRCQSTNPESSGQHHRPIDRTHYVWCHSLRSSCIDGTE